MTTYNYKLFRAIVMFSGVFVIGIALFIFGYIFLMGIQSISIEFLTDRPRGLPLGTEGGVLPAIMGTIYLGALSGFIAGIVGSVTAIFLVFYCQNNFVKKAINTSTYFLAGMPSILFGLVGYAILISRFGLPRSLLVAGITVSIMIMPYITIRLVKVFSEDGSDILNASLCLGLSRWYVMQKLILPNYLINIITSTALGMAYGVGAAAPVMFTGAVILAETPSSIMSPFMSLAYHLFILVSEGISMDKAYGSALLLLLLLLVVNIICRVLENLREGAEWRFGKGK